jgi:hypothetical protein
MSDAYATCNGQRISAITINVANVGPWIAEIDFEESPDVSGAVTIRIGDGLTLRGTVIASQDGTHLDQRRCRVVGGAGGWGRFVGRKNYHNDVPGGVKSRLVAEDAAREVGETLGDFAPETERVGKDYVRSVGTASRVLEHVIGDVPWWVDYEGRTCVGTRPSVPVTLAEGYDVLQYDPRNRVLTFSIERPELVSIGLVISQPPLEAPQTIREFDLHVEPDGTRVVAWCGGSDNERGRLAGLMRTIARRATDDALYGKYRYRVVTMRGDGRVELQAVRKAAGLPDVQPISMWPGVAGAHAELAQGAEVLVEFIEGDPTQPIITHFAGVDGAGFVPVSLAFCGSVQAAARQGDLVQSGGVGTQAIFTSTPSPPGGPTPMLEGTPYFITFSSNPDTIGALAAPLYGAISTGSPKVRV